MRFRNSIVTLNLLYGLLAARGVDTTNTTAQAPDIGYFTNFSSSISLSDFSSQPAAKQTPICYVYLGNNRVPGSSFDKANCDFYLNMPPERLFDIELIDPIGTLVAKTAKGLQFGLPLTSQQIIDWNSEMMARRWRSRLLMICPGQSRMVGVFSIPEMFEIKQAGEYTLHVRMRLIINMQCAWLPEAIGKVLIRPEEILPLRSPHVGGTNISAK